MVGYYHDPVKPAETIDSDGWVHSGDIAELGPDGHYRIVDRKYELIITSSGKNISPANLEAVAKSSPIIGQAVAIGDGHSRHHSAFVAARSPGRPDVGEGSWHHVTIAGRDRRASVDDQPRYGARSPSPMTAPAGGSNSLAICSRFFPTSGRLSPRS